MQIGGTLHSLVQTGTLITSVRQSAFSHSWVKQAETDAVRVPRCDNVAMSAAHTKTASALTGKGGALAKRRHPRVVGRQEHMQRTHPNRVGHDPRNGRLIKQSQIKKI